MKWQLRVRKFDVGLFLDNARRRVQWQKRRRRKLCLRWQPRKNYIVVSIILNSQMKLRWSSETKLQTCPWNIIMIIRPVLFFEPDQYYDESLVTKHKLTARCTTYEMQSGIPFWSPLCCKRYTGECRPTAPIESYDLLACHHRTWNEGQHT
jgi:hypothetical protein